MAKKASAPAYFLVDLTKMKPAVAALIKEDAAAGGGDYGVRVVEIVHNGPAQYPLYGVYYGEHEELWTDAKKELGVEEKIDDEDPELQEDAMREQAKADAVKEAALIKAREDAENEGITKNKAAR